MKNVFEHSTLPVDEKTLIEDLKKFSLPLTYGNKAPRISGWQEYIWDELDNYTKKTRDKKTGKIISEEPSDKPGRMREYASGFAVNTGRAGLVVIDLDVKDGKNGIENYEKACAELGIEPFNTLTVRTGSGGLHVYFRAGEHHFVNTQNDRLSIDIRANGGCATGPGTKVWDESKGETKKDARVYKIDNVAPVLPLPDELAQWLRNVVNAKEKTEDVGSDSLAPEGLEPKSSMVGFTTRQREVLTTAVDIVSRKLEPGRDEALSDHSYNCGAAGIPVEVIVKELERAAKSAPNPLDDDVIEEKVARRAWDGRRKYMLPSAKSNEWRDTRMANRALQELGLLYNLTDRKWYSYDDTLGVWAVDHMAEGKVQDWIDKTAYRLEERNDEGDYALAGALLKKRYTTDVLNSMKAAATVQEDRFDQFPHIRTVKNGVLNLKTMELTPHSKHYYMRKYIPVNWNPEATSKVYDQAMKALPEDAIDWMMTMAGNALVDAQPASSSIMFLYGTGGNGKSVLLDLLEATAGTYSDRPPQKALLGDDDFSALSFAGVSQAIMEELPKPKNSATAVLNLDMIKTLLGTRKMKARKLFQDFREFNPVATVFISTNHYPRVHDATRAAWRRLRMVPFTKKFTEGGGGIADMMSAHEDVDAQETMLRRRVEAASRWLNASKQGRLDLEEPPRSVVDATNYWRYNDDPLNLFASEALTFGENKSTPFRHLLIEYQQWCQAYGYKALSGQKLLERLSESQQNSLESARGAQKGYELWTSDLDDAPTFRRDQSVVLGVALSQGSFNSLMSRLPADYVLTEDNPDEDDMDIADDISIETTDDLDAQMDKFDDIEYDILDDLDDDGLLNL